MAKIYLNIEADGPEDLQQALLQLATGGVPDNTNFNRIYAGLTDAAEGRSTPVEQTPDETATKRRGRPPKAEASPVAEPTPNNSLADQIKQAEAEVEAEQVAAGGPTQEDVTNVLKAYAAKHSMVHAQNKLKELTGAGRVSEVPVEKYADVIAGFNLDL